MPIQRLTLTTEFDNDEFLTPVRIIHADRMAVASTAKKRGWTDETHPYQLLALMAWQAAKRTDQFTESFDKFQDSLIQVHQDIEDVDPTQRASKKGSTSS